MFNIDDFWKIFNFLKNDSDPDPNFESDLDESLQALAKSENITSENLFSSIIDQSAHNSSDYRRLKKFLTKWYASHRTITTTQKQCTDPYTLPIEHLDELIKSFGFNHSNKFLFDDSKPNFFLDLVNLYKIKGTPEALKKAIEYYGLTNLDIAELWLIRENNKLLFRSIEESYSDIELPYTDADFNAITNADPHWFLKKEEIDLLELSNKIKLPSKSPYLSLRPIYVTEELEKVIAIISRKIQDDYYAWNNNNQSLDKNIRITDLNINISFLEMYLATIYAMNEYYNINNQNNWIDNGSLFHRNLLTNITSIGNFICYNGDLDYSNNPKSVMTSYEDVISRNNIIRNELNDIISSIPVTRDEKKIKISEYYNLFTRDLSTSFIQNNDTVESALLSINPTLKSLVDTMLNTNREEEIINSLLFEMANWTVNNISVTSPNTAAQALGLEIYPGLIDIINFFKPYRARYIIDESIHIFDNALLDSVLLDDKCTTELHQNSYDYSNYGISCGTGYNRETYDCGSYFDIGAAFDKEIEYTHEESLRSNLGKKLGNLDVNLFVKNTSYLLPNPNDENIILETLMTNGGWLDLDNGAYMDETYGNDICFIYIEELNELNNITYLSTENLMGLSTEFGLPITV